MLMVVGGMGKCKAGGGYGDMDGAGCGDRCSGGGNSIQWMVVVRERGDYSRRPSVVRVLCWWLWM